MNQCSTEIRRPLWCGVDPSLYIKIVGGVGATLIALLILISSFRHKGILASFLIRSWKLPKEWKTILLVGLFCFVGQWLCRIKVVVKRDTPLFVDVVESYEAYSYVKRPGLILRKRIFSGTQVSTEKKDTILTLSWPIFSMWSVATPDPEELPVPPPSLFVSVGFFGRLKAFKSDLLLLQPFPTAWKRFFLGVLSCILAIYFYFKRIHPLAIEQDTHSSCWFDLPVSSEESECKLN